jgi:hypothetical protein
MSNMDIWDKFKQPPLKALKKIEFGRLKGKTDINPQWRMQVMTEVFGACGEGWKYSIDRLWTEPGTDGQVFAFSQVSLFTNSQFVNQKWSDAIPGIGGSMLLQIDKNGLHHNDEAFKMATTDALSVAMKALGVAADIYLGLFDGSKYAEFQSGIKAALPENITPNRGAGDSLTQDQRNYLADMAILIKDCWEVDNFKDLYDNYLSITELDHKNYLWSLLDSKIRAKIKAIGQERKLNV